MIKYNYHIVCIFFVSVLTSCSQPNTSTNTQPAKVTPENKQLNDLRNQMSKVYKDNEDELRIKKEGPCDSYFKVIHQIDKEEFNYADVIAFMELDLSKCPNNVELSQSYNERLFRLAEKKPNLFIRGTEKVSIINNKEFVKQWQSPIHDGIEKTKIENILIGLYKDKVEGLKKDLRTNRAMIVKLEQTMDVLTKKN